MVVGKWEGYFKVAQCGMKCLVNRREQLPSLAIFVIKMLRSI